MSFLTRVVYYVPDKNTRIEEKESNLLITNSFIIYTLAVSLFSLFIHVPYFLRT